MFFRSSLLAGSIEKADKIISDLHRDGELERKLALAIDLASQVEVKSKEVKYYSNLLMNKVFEDPNGKIKNLFSNAKLMIGECLIVVNGTGRIVGSVGNQDILGLPYRRLRGKMFNDVFQGVVLWEELSKQVKGKGQSDEAATCGNNLLDLVTKFGVRSKVIIDQRVLEVSLMAFYNDNKTNEDVYLCLVTSTEAATS